MSTDFQFHFRSEHPGIVTRHAFSAGAHYDPQRLSFGPVIGCDVHDVAPGAGFGWHAHAGVVIVSLVLTGTLRHEDDGGEAVELPAGEQVLVQRCGAGIRHAERNASGSEPLRFVQTTLLLDSPRSVRVAEPPVPLGTDIVFGADGAVTFVCGPVRIAMSDRRTATA